jgi:GH43 family beta-xylosidase
VLWKTKSLTDLQTAPQKTVFKPPKGTMYSKQLWAPELHYINNRWYLYFAADSGRNEDHRIWVLENAAKDPLEGEWTLKGKVADATNKWAIDASVFQHNKTLYMVWSGWEGDSNGQQDIYIARLKNPWTIDGKRVRIASPVFDWERHGDLKRSGQSTTCSRKRRTTVSEARQQSFFGVFGQWLLDGPLRFGIAIGRCYKRFIGFDFVDKTSGAGVSNF